MGGSKNTDKGVQFQLPIPYKRRSPSSRYQNKILTNLPLTTQKYLEKAKEYSDRLKKNYFLKQASQGLELTPIKSINKNRSSIDGEQNINICSSSNKK